MTGPALDEVARRLARAAGSGGAAVVVRRDEPLAPFTTYRVGGPAALFVRADDERQLEAVARAVAGTGLPTLVIGKGSNLLVADHGFAGLALMLGDAFAEVAVDGTVVRAGAAATLPVVARRTAREGLTGFEWAVGVPGSVGGGVRMNAGGHGSDMAATLTRIRLVDLAVGGGGEVPAADLALGYRRSSVAAHQVVVRADLRLAEGDREAAEAEISEIVRWRREHQPGGPNAGSVFTNPAGDSAGRLIDEAGLKGFRLGTASISTKHANFIQADEGGAADDVHRLMAEVRRRVLDHHGVDLVPETRMVGFDDADPHPPVEVEVEVEVDGGRG
jgi:UDP-N-acetylmuramate dehydrogenase